MVEISIARYETLIAAERDAKLFRRLLEMKAAHFSPITATEIQDLKELFLIPSAESEARE